LEAGEFKTSSGLSIGRRKNERGAAREGKECHKTDAGISGKRGGKKKGEGGGGEIINWKAKEKVWYTKAYISRGTWGGRTIGRAKGAGGHVQEGGGVYLGGGGRGTSRKQLQESRSFTTGVSHD